MDSPTSIYEYVRCDLCGRDDTDFVLAGKDLYNGIPGEFRVVRCNNCSFIYTNPRPGTNEMKKYYPDDSGYFKPVEPIRNNGFITRLKRKVINSVLSSYMGYCHLSKVNTIEKILLYPVFLTIRRNFDIDGIPVYVKNGKLLDVGCSYGSYLKQMKDLGWDVTGIEANSKSSQYGNTVLGVKIINSSFENADIDEKFDVIALRMALEHIPHPNEVLSRLYDMLRDDGKLIIIVPDFHGLEFRLYKNYCYALHLPAHLNHFTPSTMSKFCEKHGLVVEKIIHHKFDRDIVASAQYMKNDGVNSWLAPVLSNKVIRKTVVRAFVSVLSRMEMTSRMTIIASKDLRHVE